MFVDLITEPFAYVDPWLAHPLEARLTQLRRGRPRIAWLYEQPDTSTFRYRCLNPATTLADARPDVGAAWFSGAEIPALMREVATLDVLVICRFRYDAAVARLIMRARAAGVRVLFDCDDLVFETRHVHLLLDTLDQDTANPACWDSWFAVIGRLGCTASLCSGGIATNGFLAARMARAFNWSHVGILPNYLNVGQEAVSRELLAKKRARGFRGDGRVTIGYFSGTPTHNKDFAVAVNGISSVMQADPGVDLLAVGFLDSMGPLARFGERVKRIPLQDYLNLQHMIAKVELNIAPLQDNEFTNCKSELKFFEAAAVGTWTLATPTYTFSSAIEDGVTGRLVQVGTWKDALTEAVALARDPGRYARAAEATAASAYARYGWDKFADTILSAVGLPGERRSAA
ncbi:MAG: glycosyltransferase [Acetobacteraceae bacterium]|nr:glycosyltransferase [Acetobacteraceae bacterium]